MRGHEVTNRALFLRRYLLNSVLRLYNVSPLSLYTSLVHMLLLFVVWVCMDMHQSFLVLLFAEIVSDTGQRRGRIPQRATPQQREGH